MRRGRTRARERGSRVRGIEAATRQLDSEAGSPSAAAGLKEADRPLGAQVALSG